MGLCKKITAARWGMYRSVWVVGVLGCADAAPEPVTSRGASASVASGTEVRREAVVADYRRALAADEAIRQFESRRSAEAPLSIAAPAPAAGEFNDEGGIPQDRLLRDASLALSLGHAVAEITILTTGEIDHYPLEPLGRFTQTTKRFRARLHQSVRRVGLATPDAEFDLYASVDWTPPTASSNPTIIALLHDQMMRPGFHLVVGVPVDVSAGRTLTPLYGSAVGVPVREVFDTLQREAARLPVLGGAS